MIPSGFGYVFLSFDLIHMTSMTIWRSTILTSGLLPFSDTLFFSFISDIRLLLISFCLLVFGLKNGTFCSMCHEYRLGSLCCVKVPVMVLILFLSTLPCPLQIRVPMLTVSASTPSKSPELPTFSILRRRAARFRRYQIVAMVNCLPQTRMLPGRPQKPSSSESSIETKCPIILDLL